MIWIFAALVVLGGVGLFFGVPSIAEGATMTSSNDFVAPSIDSIFQKWGDYYNVDWKLLKAIAMNESSLNPNAVNSADNESLGLMQVLCRPNGKGGCLNTFNVEGWSEATRDKLLTPDFNVKIGAGIFAWNQEQFGLPKAIAVYNKWNERTSPQEGPFENQQYVDRVLNNYRSIA